MNRLSVSIRRSSKRDMLLVSVRREYRFTPHVDSLRFACVASNDDYETLLRDPETAEVWRTRSADGIDAADESAFVLTGVELDGEPQPFRRSTRKGWQVYTCRLGKAETGHASRHLAYSFDVLVPRSKHCVYFDFGRPTKGLTIEVEHDDSVDELQLLDFIGKPADLRRARHHGAADGDCSVATDDWIVPRAGAVAVWK